MTVEESEKMFLEQGYQDAATHDSRPPAEHLIPPT